VRLDDSPATRANLQAAIARRPQLIRSVPLPGWDTVTGLVPSPDGRTLAVHATDGRVEVYDVSTWEPTTPLLTPPESEPSLELVAPVAYSPDGGVLALGLPLLAPEPLQLLDAGFLARLPLRLPGLRPPTSTTSDRVLDLAWSAERDVLAATVHRLEVVSEPGVTYWDAPSSRLLAWDVRDPASPRLVLDKALPGRETTVRDRNVLALSADGRTVWTSNPLTAPRRGDRSHPVPDRHPRLCGRCQP